MSANVAWGCGSVPLGSAQEYYEVMEAVEKVRYEWEETEPFLQLRGVYFWKLLMCRFYYRAVNLGIIPANDVLNIKGDISCRDYQLEMFFG